MLGKPNARQCIMPSYSLAFLYPAQLYARSLAVAPIRATDHLPCQTATMQVDIVTSELDDSLRRLSGRRAKPRHRPLPCESKSPFFFTPLSSPFSSSNQPPCAHHKQLEKSAATESQKEGDQNAGPKNYILPCCRKQAPARLASLREWAPLDGPHPQTRNLSMHIGVFGMQPSCRAPSAR